MKKKSDRQQTSDDWTAFVNGKNKKLSLSERGRVREVVRDAMNKKRRDARAASRKAGEVPKELDSLYKIVTGAYKPLGNERQVRFVRYLAEYLVGDQVHKSILLQMQSPTALEWQKLRAATPLFGYPTVDEAEEELTLFLKGL